MLLYLSESKIESIVNESYLFSKKTFFNKYFDSISAKLELAMITIEGILKKQNNDSIYRENTILGVIEFVTDYLQKKRKMHKFNKKTKKLKIMNAYQINATLSILEVDNPDMDFSNNNIHIYINENPNKLVTLTLTTVNPNFPTIKIDCSNKYLWYSETLCWGKPQFRPHSIGQRLDLKSSQMIVDTVIFITHIDKCSNAIFGSPLYITI